MDYNSPFRLSQDEYHRDIDVIDAYYEQLALYIHTVTNGKYSLEFCRQQVEEMFQPGGELVHEFPCVRCGCAIKRPAIAKKNTPR